MRGSNRETPKKKAKRTTGEGTFETLPSGLIRCYTRLNGKKVSGKGKTRKEASDDLKANLKLSGASAAGATSFGTLAERWLQTKKKYSPTTKEVVGYWISDLKKDPLGQTPVSKVTLQALKGWKERQSLANATLRNRCRWLNQVLAYSGSEVRVVVPPKEDHERRPLTPDERALIAQRMANADPTILLACLLCWHCGLRRSEACGLMHEDRDGDGFWVRRGVVIVKGKLIVRPKALNKRKKGGWVPLPPSLLATIGSGKGFVLGDEHAPMNPKSLTWHMECLTSGTALDKVPYMGTHALRRTYGMMLLETGTDVVTAATAMRHDPKMLMDEYARSRRDLMTAATDRAFGTGGQEGRQTA